MRVTVSVWELKEILDVMSRFVSRHSTLPVLENIYIKWTTDSLLFRATDMEKYIEVNMDASPDNEGTLTVNAKTFSDIVKVIEDQSVTLIIEETSTQLTLKTDTDEFIIKWIPSTEYVSLPKIENQQELELEVEKFVEWIAKVEFAVTEKNFSPVLTGVYIRLKQEWTDTFLIFVWTDSFRLSEYKIPYAGEYQEMNMILPKTHINDLKKVAEYASSKWWTTLSMRYAENMIELTYVIDWINITSSCLLIQWSFPDYEQESIMPTNFTTKSLINASQLEKSIKKIEILTRDLNNYILISWDAEKLSLTSWSTDRWNADTSLSAFVEWPAFSYWVNGKYITDFLRTLESENTIMRVIDWEKPIIFLDEWNDNIMYVVRPLVK